MSPVLRHGERAYCITVQMPPGLTAEGRYRFSEDRANRAYIINPSESILSRFPLGSEVSPEAWKNIASILRADGYELDTRRGAYVKRK